MAFQNKALKTTEEVALQILLFCLVGIGSVANILLFVRNFPSIFTVHRLKPTQVILTNLAVANAFILLATAFTNDMAVFVPRTPPTDLKCKTEFFVCLVARSTNMCSTSILSTYQFVTLVPGNWVRGMLQGRAPNALSYSSYSCWFFGALSNVYISTRVRGPQSTGNDTDSKSKWFCSTSGFDIDMISIWYAHDAVFISIMVWTSVSMVLLLHRHRQRLRHIHTCNQDHRGHAETRAAHTILMLVSTFVGIYLLDCICIFFLVSFVDSRLWLRHAKQVLSLNFPIICPLLLLCRDPRILVL